VAQFNVLLRNLPGGTEKNYGKPVRIIGGSVEPVISLTCQKHCGMSVYYLATLVKLKRNNIGC
jgi:hypothetical protein